MKPIKTAKDYYKRHWEGIKPNSDEDKIIEIMKDWHFFVIQERCKGNRIYP